MTHERRTSEEDLAALFSRNREWADSVRATDTGFFDRLQHQQAPEYLWIGCSDSRVPANEIVGLEPGELFVHRNVANVVVHSDLNCLSVIQFAIELLAVRHVIVVGHYGCSGVKAALTGTRVGLADNWLRHVQDVHARHAHWLDALPEDRRHGALCELNTLEQALNVCETTVMHDAWAREQDVAVHALVYGLDSGLLEDLGLGIRSAADAAACHSEAVSRVRDRQRSGAGSTRAGNPPAPENHV